MVTAMPSPFESHHPPPRQTENQLFPNEVTYDLAPDHPYPPQPFVTTQRGTMSIPSTSSADISDAIRQQVEQLSVLMSQLPAHLRTPIPRPLQAPAPQTHDGRYPGAPYSMPPDLLDVANPSPRDQHASLADVPSFVPEESTILSSGQHHPPSFAIPTLSPIVDDDHSLATSHITTPDVGDHYRVIEGTAADRLPSSRDPRSYPCRVRFLDRHLFLRSRSTHGRIIRWHIRLEESYPLAFTNWQIPLPPGDYLYEDFGCNLCIVGLDPDTNTPVLFTFPVSTSYLWDSQGIPGRTVSLNDHLTPGLLPPVPTRALRLDGFLHPSCYGVPGHNDTCRGSRQPVYTPSALFCGDGLIIAKSYAAAYYRGRAAAHFAGSGKLNPVKAHTSITAARQSYRQSAPPTASLPEVVPYVRHQLVHLDLLVEGDCGGEIWNPVTFRNRTVGRNTPQLYAFHGDHKTTEAWTPEFSVAPTMDLESTNGSAPPADSTQDPDTSSAADTVLTTSTYSTSAERERSKDRLANLDIQPLPPAGEGLREWVLTLPWVLSGEQWCHQGVHATDIKTTTTATQSLSYDLLAVFKRAVAGHKTTQQQRNARSLLLEHANDVDGAALVKAGKGFELFHQRIRAGFSRGLGSEILDSLLQLVQCVQHSQETVGAFFDRAQQLYNQVRHSAPDSELGDIVRKALLLEGLRRGAYSEALKSWVDRVLLGQGHYKLTTSTIADLQSGASAILASSSYMKHNTLQPGRSTSQARVATSSDNDTTPDPQLDIVIQRLQKGHALNRDLTTWLRNRFRCPLCWSNDHDLVSCRSAGTTWSITTHKSGQSGSATSRANKASSSSTSSTPTSSSANDAPPTSPSSSATPTTDGESQSCPSSPVPDIPADSASSPDFTHIQALSRVALAAVSKAKSHSGDNLGPIARYTATSRPVCPDSGATHTMCPHRDMFTDYHSLPTGAESVRLGDDSVLLPVLGRGTLVLRLDGHSIALPDVLHVPALSMILLSTRIHRRFGAGCSFIADSTGCYLTFPTFVVNVDDTSDCVISGEYVDPTATQLSFDGRLCYEGPSDSGTRRMLRDARLAAMISARQGRHTSLSTAPITASSPSPPIRSIPPSGSASKERLEASNLKLLFGSRNLANWKDLEKLGQDTISVVADRSPPTSLSDSITIKRNKHGGLLERPATILDTVGMDIGYGDGTSPGGYKYTLMLVDFASRYTWCYGLRNKSASAVIQALWEFFLDCGGFPRRIRCDFDPSFVHGDVLQFLQRNLIQVSASPPYRQSQNGAVERQWQTALGMARSFLVQAHLPRRYWFWALREATFRMNLLPCRSRTTPSSPSTPFELFYGSKPDYRVLFHWGSLGYFRRDGTPDGKFGSQSGVGIALGRSSHTNGMIFWVPTTQRMVVSADFRLDPTGAVQAHFPSVQYDGLFTSAVLRGGVQQDKEPFPPETTVQIRTDETITQGTVTSVPLRSSPVYTVKLKETGENIQVSPENIYAMDEIPTASQPDQKTSLTSPRSDPSPEVSVPSPPPPLPEVASKMPTPPTPGWLVKGTKVQLHQDGRHRKGTLHVTDAGWVFQQFTASGRPTYTLNLADLPITWESRLEEGSLTLGWSDTPSARHVSAKGIKNGVPTTFKKSMAKGYVDRDIWVDSYQEEADGLKEQDTYVVLSLQEYQQKYPNVQIIPSMCVQTIKKDEYGIPVRAKSRIVALGNFEDTVWEKADKFAPVLRDTSSRTMTSMAVQSGRREKQGDCKNAFCQSYLPADEIIILRPPQGCPLSKPGDLWLLRKTLYGLRRSPHHWYNNIKGIFLKMGLKQSPHDPCVFYGTLREDLPPIYIGLYVDDFKYYSLSDEVEKIFEETLQQKCKVDFMGEVSWFLGCKYEWEDIPDPSNPQKSLLTVSITQTAKIEDVLEKHGMTDCNPAPTPYRSGLVIDRIPHDGVDPKEKSDLVRKFQQLVGGLLWIQRQSRPDISTAVTLLATHAHNPSKGHYEAGKRVLAYLKGTSDRGIRFVQNGTPISAQIAFPTDDGTYTDANWGPQDASHPKDNETVTIAEVQSLLGHVVLRMGGPVVWGCTRERSTVSRSSCESEIYATDEGVKSTLTVRHLLQDLNCQDGVRTTPIWNDNRGCVDWTKGVTVSKKLRHVNMRELGVRLAQQNEEVHIRHIEGKLNLADIFTKEIRDDSHFVEMAQVLTTPRLVKDWISSFESDRNHGGCQSGQGEDVTVKERVET